MIIDKSIIKRYYGLPGKSLLEKIMYIAYRRLSNRLISHRIIDVNGWRCENRVKHIGHKYTCGCIPKKLVSISGTGYSGSSAIADILAEYSCIKTFADADRDGSLQSKSTGIEFDLLSCAGGLFDIENALITQSEVLQDATIKEFLVFVGHLYVEVGGPFGDDFVQITRKFLDDIILYRSSNDKLDGYSFSPHLRHLGHFGAQLVFGDEGESSVIWLKPLEIHEYRSIAHSYLEKILSLFDAPDYLALDLAVRLSGTVDNLSKFHEYLGDFKLIAVIRDPRDVFATAIINKVKWIPLETESYISWYKRRLAPYEKLKHDDFLSLRFENVVCDYQRTIMQLENFLGLSSDMHTKRMECFDPEVSRKNVGIFKTINYNATITTIEKQLSTYCWG